MRKRTRSNLFFWETKKTCKHTSSRSCFASVGLTPSARASFCRKMAEKKRRKTEMRCFISFAFHLSLAKNKRCGHLSIGNLLFIQPEERKTKQESSKLAMVRVYSDQSIVHLVGLSADNIFVRYAS